MFQKDKHQRKDYSKQIERYRKRIRNFQRDNPSFSRTQIKKTFMEQYNQEVDADAELDIFDGVYDEEK